MNWKRHAHCWMNAVIAAIVVLSLGVTCKKQQPPSAPPALSGPDSGLVDISYTFTTSALDPEGDPIRYEFEWGDGSPGLTEYYPSGESVQQSHAWSHRGAYQLRVRAQDSCGNTSDWFEGRPITISGYPSRILATVRVGAFPYGLAVLPDGKYVYVTDNNMSDTVFVIRALDNKVVSKVVLPRGSDSFPCDPIGATALPNGEYVYVTSYTTASVFVIRTSDNVVVARIPVGGYPWGIATSPDGGSVYVVATADDNVWVIRTSDNTVVAQIPLGDLQSTDLAVLPAGDYLYVGGDKVSVIRTSHNQVVARINVGAGYVAASPDAQFVYASCGSSIAMIRTSDNRVVSSLPFQGLSAGIAALPGGHYIYVASYFDKSVSIIRVSDSVVVKKIHVGDTPRPLAVSADGERVYVVNLHDETVSVIGY
jgi:YVTN family beta-propeller protein